MASIEFSIRAAQPQDAASLAVLATQLGYPSTAEQVESRLDEIRRDPRQRLRVAQAKDGTVAGWMHLAVTNAVESDPAVEIRGLVVEESWRSSGIGRRLIADAEAWARDEGVATLRARSNVIRERAHGFYLKLGFERVKSQHTFVKAL